MLKFLVRSVLLIVFGLGFLSPIYTMEENNINLIPQEKRVALTNYLA
jgi:hypothetical protein